MIKLIPQPKKIKFNSGNFMHKGIKPLCYSSDLRINKALKNLPIIKEGANLSIEITGGESEKYTLKLENEEIIIKAENVKGVFYGIQTLRQIFKNEDIPNLSIEDEPDFCYRGFYHDVSRGKIPTVETLKSLIDKMAYFKLNSLQLYVEHTFEFKEYEDIIKRTGYLTKEEIKELDDYCYDNFIEFVPSVSTFGHLYELLESEKYKELCVIENFKKEEHLWLNRMKHHTIDPLNPESIKVIESIITQYIPHFKTDKFNICCDETFDLQIIAHVKSRGKSVMMWADILLKYPEVIDELPKDIYLLNWWYDKDVREEDIESISKSGRNQIVCPGTTTWSRFSEDTDISKENISKMAEYGYKHGAVGVLNTNWGDYGNPCSLELSMYSLVLGAEKSWSVNTVADRNFDKKVNLLLYDNENGVKILEKLNDMHRKICFGTLVRNYSDILFERSPQEEYADLEAIREVQKSYIEIKEQLYKEKWQNDEFREEFLISAEALCVIAELMAKIQKFKLSRVTDTEKWLLKYREKWINKNKENELGNIEEIIRYFEGEF